MDAPPRLAAALREFEEELGTAPPTGEADDLGEIRQRSGKRVRAWALAGDLDASRIVSNTFMFEGYMVTPRGYTNKYTWDGEAIAGQTPARSLVLEGVLEDARVEQEQEEHALEAEE